MPAGRLAAIVVSSSGSDAANIRTTAVRDGNRSLVRGVYGGLGSIGDGVAGIAHSSGGYLKDAAGSAAKACGTICG